MSYDEHLRNPLMDVLAARGRRQSGFYSAAFWDTRFSSGFGMYPSSYKPKEKGGSLAAVLVKFGFVGGIGLFLNQYILLLLTNLYGISYLLFNAFLSSQAAVLVNFSMNELVVFRSRSGTSLLRRIFLFNLVSSADLVVRLPLLWSLTNVLGIWFFSSNLISIFLTFAARFIVSERKIWAKK